MLKIKISNTITIEEPPSKLVVAVKGALTIDNPVYHKNKRMGIKVWDSMRFYKYYQLKADNTLCVPRGFRGRLLAWLDRQGMEYEVEENLINRSL